MFMWWGQTPDDSMPAPLEKKNKSRSFVQDRIRTDSILSPHSRLAYLSFSLPRKADDERFVQLLGALRVVGIIMDIHTAPIACLIPREKSAAHFWCSFLARCE